MDDQGPVEILTATTAYDTDGASRAGRILALLAVLAALLVLAMASLFAARQPLVRYFATTQAGELKAQSPADQANLRESELLSWATLTVIESMTLGYHDYELRLEQAARNFTAKGWASFVQSLQTERILRNLTGAQQVLYAQPMGAPVITRAGAEGGYYHWYVDMKLELAFEGEGGTSATRGYALAMDIIRVPRGLHPLGVEVDNWSIRPVY